VRTIAIESPYVGDVAIASRNLAYARAALKDSLLRGEPPFTSHLLYTQVLDDADPEQRRLGIEAGLALAERLDLTAVYVDLGISIPDMRQGIDQADADGRPVQYRALSWPSRSWSTLDGLRRGTGLVVTPYGAMVPITQSIDQMRDVYGADVLDPAHVGDVVVPPRSTDGPPGLPPELLALPLPKDEP